MDELEADGWVYLDNGYGSYDYDAKQYQKDGYQTKGFYIRSDTPGVKMWQLYGKINDNTLINKTVEQAVNLINSGKNDRLQILVSKLQNTDTFWNKLRTALNAEGIDFVIISKDRYITYGSYICWLDLYNI